MTDVIVIGAGVNGLVAGAWLAKRKRSTIILDQRPAAGGAAITEEFAPGFRAPTLAHALGPIHRDVIRALRLDRAGLEFITPDPSLTSLGRNGDALVFHRDPVLTAGDIDRFSGKDAGRWREFLQTTQRISRLVAALQAQTPPSLDETAGRELWGLLQVGRRARALGNRDLARFVRWLPMPVADLVDEWFDSDSIKAAIAARALFGNFAGPRSAGTSAVLLQRLGEDPVPVGSGVTVKGGPGALSEALVKLAERPGALVRTGARVARILTSGGRATGVVLESGEEIRAGAVVSTVDPKQTFLKLVDSADLPPSFFDRVRNYRARGVTAKINLALSGAPIFPALHNDPVPLRGRFLIAPDLDYLERAFDAAKYGTIPAEPWLEISLPTSSDPSLADGGRHIMSVYAHCVPRQLRGSSWATERDALYRTVLNVLTAHIPGLPALIVNRQVLTPEDLERHWGLSGGHIFHGEPTLDQFWISRPLLGWAQYRTPIDKLYLAGAGTHPGGGLTGMSGLLAAKAIHRDLG